MRGHLLTEHFVLTNHFDKNQSANIFVTHRYVFFSFHLSEFQK